MKARLVRAWDPKRRKYRLFRITWLRGHYNQHDAQGRPVPYSFMLEACLRPCLVGYWCEERSWEMCLLGVGVKYAKSAGGRFS